MIWKNEKKIIFSLLTFIFDLCFSFLSTVQYLHKSVSHFSCCILVQFNLSSSSCFFIVTFHLFFFFLIFLFYIFHWQVSLIEAQHVSSTKIYYKKSMSSSYFQLTISFDFTQCGVKKPLIKLKNILVVVRLGGKENSKISLNSRLWDFMVKHEKASINKFN